MLEAPITGGLEALKKGQMTVFIAGEKDVAEQVFFFIPLPSSGDCSPVSLH